MFLDNYRSPDMNPPEPEETYCDFCGHPWKRHEVATYREPVEAWPGQIVGYSTEQYPICPATLAPRWTIREDGHERVSRFRNNLYYWNKRRRPPFGRYRSDVRAWVYELRRERPRYPRRGRRFA